MKSLGVAIITFNEEENIAKVINSVPFAQDIVVVDSFSTDNTVTIAKNLGARVFEKKWEGYSKQKQYCLEQLETDWVLVLDGDEWLSDELQNEIKDLLSLEEQPFYAYNLKRKILFLERLLNHGKGVDFQLRLLKNGVGHYDGREIHEKIVVDTPVGQLKHHIVHKSAKTINDELEKMMRDTEMELPYYDGAPIGLSDIIGKPFSFYFTMLLKGMWRDGVPGHIFLLLVTYKYVILYSKLYELSLKK